MRLPDHPADISEAYLVRCAEPLLDRQVRRAALRSLTTISTGTSGDEVHELVVSVDDQPLRLVLKINEPGEVAETLFYRDLRESVPVDTPRVADARVLADGRGWILMERVEGRDHETWSDDDYRSVVEAMAAMHATCAAGAVVERCPWIWRPTPDALGEIIGGLKDLTALVGAAEHLGPLASVYPRDRLRRIRAALDRAEELIEPMLATSETLVHGDYWFRNVMASADDRYVLLDWQGCRVFSGTWELAYFVDLLRALGPGRYRPLPVPEADLTAWYLTALRNHGRTISDSDFGDVYLRSQVIQPLAHWLLNNALTIATGGAATFAPETGVFLRHEFTRWDRAASDVLAL